MSDQTQRIAVSVLTGFLGSGKSTVLGRLLTHPEMDETAVIVNEFGEVGIDHALVAGSDENTVLMSSGCLCCTIRGDLIDTLRDLFGRRERGEVPAFKRVVVETTGLADPAPILHTLMADRSSVERFRLDGVISTVDAANGAATLDNHTESVKQAAVADRILLSKIDLATTAMLEDIQARLSAINPSAPLIPVTMGDVHPDALFDAGLYDPATKTADVRRWLRDEAYAASDPHGGHEHHDHDVNRHNDKISAFCLYFETPFEWEKLSYWLELLATYRGDDLLRVKGLFNVVGLDVPLVVHGVQHIFHPPATIEGWPDDDRRSRVVFITRNLDRGTIEKTLAGVNTGPLPSATPA